ncbi:HNH endonuclease [Brevibacillus aydinogluensis]|uniref:HNH domain-containing protein n=1 Tax=Brevibacillus aydinogluensis TaxID=927786 RepID=A0AA48MBU7_9BACL|nr:HNH endonuclease signature motif containing protein [Brevibacillus aydinogluensis]CAJ1003929.1 hypothetical protein BSPP4475_16515 [Brevibacillus aydinogluensis]
MNRTIYAMIARGIDIKTAHLLWNQNFTMGKLMQSSKDELKKLGLGDDVIRKIHSKRPPIPEPVLNKVLWESRYTCCVCREHGRPYIIHHIEPWHVSKSHDEDNLIVLCVECHDEAHTSHENSLNLTAQRLRDAKKRWLEEVRKYDRESVHQLINTDTIFWDYFNLTRLVELIDACKIKIYECDYFNYLVANRLMDINGRFLFNNWPQPKNYSYWIDFFEGNYIYLFLKWVVTNLISKTNFKQLNDLWTKSKITTMVNVNDFVMIKGAFYFKNNRKRENNECLVYRKAKGIKVSFSIDKWYCNSASAKANLAGKRNVTVFARVREITNDDYGVHIRCTALAIATGLATLGENSPLDMEDINDEEFQKLFGFEPTAPF